MSKRDALRSIFWILDNGAKWKDLPRRFGDNVPGSVYSQDLVVRLSLSGWSRSARPDCGEDERFERLRNPRPGMDHRGEVRIRVLHLSAGACAGGGRIYPAFRGVFVPCLQPSNLNVAGSSSIACFVT